MTKSTVWGEMAAMLIEELLIISKLKGGNIRQVEKILKEKSVDELHKILEENNMSTQSVISNKNEIVAGSVICEALGKLKKAKR